MIRHRSHAMWSGRDPDEWPGGAVVMVRRTPGGGHVTTARFGFGDRKYVITGVSPGPTHRSEPVEVFLARHPEKIEELRALGWTGVLWHVPLSKPRRRRHWR
jgi:hypothetical protein